MNISEQIPLPVFIEYLKLHLPIEYQKVNNMKDPSESAQIRIPQEHMDYLFKFNHKVKLQEKKRMMKQSRSKRL